MDKMNLGDFSPKVMAAILYAVVTLLAFSVFPMLVGAGNTIHLNTESACVWKGVRFDRVLLTKTASQTADKGTWANSLAVTNKTSTETCIYTPASGGKDAEDGALASNTSYRALLPTGEDIPAVSITLGTAVELGDGAKWEPPVDMFEDNSTLVNVVVGALALLIGVSPMTVLGMIGYYILNKFDMEQGSISTIIMVVLGAIIAVSLLSTFITFISTAYDAINASRFTVFEGGLANLAVVIKQFWGVVLVVSFFGLGAMLFKTWRDQRNGNGGGAMAESRVLS